MGNIACIFSFGLLILFLVNIKSEAFNDRKKDIKLVHVKRKLPKDKMLPTARKLRGQSQNKSQFRRKVSLKKVAQKKRKIVRNARKVKNETRTQDSAGVDTDDGKMNTKQKILKENRQKINKVRRKSKPSRITPIRRVSRKNTPRKVPLRKKSHRVRDTVKLKSKAASPVAMKKQTANVPKQTAFNKDEIEVDIERYPNRTKFYETMAGEQYRAYLKCEKEGPIIIPKNYAKLHDGHVPGGYRDCRDEMSALYEAGLKHTKASEIGKRDMWQQFQSRVHSEWGRPEKCKQWHYGIDC